MTLGWVSGQSPEDLTSTLGPSWVPSRRFGVVQGSRIRPIDDFSESLVNHVVTCCEKIDVAGVDKIATGSKLWARLLRDQEVVVALSNGEVLRGTRHEMFAKKDVCCLT